MFNFSKFSKILGYHKPGRDITIFIFKYIHINLQYALDKVFCTFLKVIDQNLDNSKKFCIGSSFSAGSSLAGLAIVFVLLFEKEEYFHSTNHYSPRRRILPLYASLLSEKEEYFHSTSHYSYVEPAVNRQPSFRTEDS